MTFMEYAKSLNIVSEHGSIVQTIEPAIVQTIEEPAGKSDAHC